MEKITKEYLIYIFAQPAINMSQFCKEAGVPRRHMVDVLEGKYNLTDKVKLKVLPVVEKYREVFDSAQAK
jgi:hypothetical protein